MELNFQSCENDSIKSGEIFLTPTGYMTIQCTLCENKFYNFQEYTNHTESDHLPVIEIKVFSESDHDEKPENNDDFNFFESGEDNNLTSNFVMETSVREEKASFGEVSSSANEIKGVIKSGSVRKRIQHDFDEINKLYKCTVCNFACKLYKNLVGHVKRHSDYRPHQCEVENCKKAFYTRFELKTHLRSHTGERPFLCNACGQSFITSGKLVDHMKRHTNEMKYQCEFCNRTFFTKQNLRRHLAVHSSERFYECKICQASFKRLTALTNHRKLHANKREYRCEMCPARFNQRAGLYSHLKSKHSLSKESLSKVIKEEQIEVVY